MYALKEKKIIAFFMPKYQMTNHVTTFGLYSISINLRRQQQQQDCQKKNFFFFAFLRYGTK